MSMFFLGKEDEDELGPAEDWLRGRYTMGLSEANYRRRIEILGQRIAELESDREQFKLQRDDALVKWHAHQKNVPCSGCKGGHDTYWKSIIESPQWQAWEKIGYKQGWDVDECAACGHISQRHFQAFMEFAKESK